MARVIQSYPPAPTTRYPLSNGAQARVFQIGPLEPERLNGKVSVQPPYANFGPQPGFVRLGLKPVKPLKGPPGPPRAPE